MSTHYLNFPKDLATGYLQLVKQEELPAQTSFLAIDSQL